MLRRLSLCLWLLLVPAAAQAQEADPAAPPDCSVMAEGVGFPRYDDGLEGSDEETVHQRLCRNGYVLSHNGERLTPDWVLERLTPDRFSKAASRSDNFAADPDLAGKPRAELSDYKGSGYDRGHMAPAADNSYSAEAMSQSFYLSNMVPQVGRNMNQGIWRELETLVRDLACERETLVVITGPIYDTPNKLRLTNPNKVPAGRVAIPDALYKIVYDPDRRQALAVLMPNKAIPIPKGTKPAAVIDGYTVPVDEVEQRTGLDFLPDLPNPQEAAVERVDRPTWRPLRGCADAPPEQVAEGPAQ